eukprot:SAG11_NODE_127_length_15677_cov_10.890872_4_plen_74_part_00
MHLANVDSMAPLPANPRVPPSSDIVPFEGGLQLQDIETGDGIPVPTLQVLVCSENMFKWLENEHFALATTCRT